MAAQLNERQTIAIEHDMPSLPGLHFSTPAIGNETCYRAHAHSIAADPQVTNVELVTAVIRWRGQNGKRTTEVIKREPITAE